MSEVLTAPLTVAADGSESFQRYYEEAGPDYAAWSANFNMHFGFFRRGMNPFKREPMLEQMNQEILHRLHVESESPGPAAGGIAARILDMGCGLGATLRSIARGVPGAELYGITLVPWQVEQGCYLNQSCAEAGRITLSLGDYERTAFASGFFDAVYAIESSCYGHGKDKSAFLEEAHRLLRPGGASLLLTVFWARAG